MEPSETTTTLLSERAKQLPEVLQQLLVSGEFEHFLVLMSTTHNLQKDQVTRLQIELLLLFLVVEPISQFATTIANDIRLSREVTVRLIIALLQSELRPLLLFSAGLSALEHGTGNDFLLSSEDRNKSKLDYMNDELIKKYTIAPDKVETYTSVVDSVVFGFYKMDQLPNFLQTEVGLPKETALAITKDLAEFLNPVLEREQKEEQIKKDSIASLADKIAAIKPVAAPAATATTPAGIVPPSEFEPVKPMRTMQTDIDDKKPVHGYGALQATTPETHDDEPVIKATPFDDLRLKP